MKYKFCTIWIKIFHEFFSNKLVQWDKLNIVLMIKIFFSFISKIFCKLFGRAKLHKSFNNSSFCEGKSKDGEKQIL